MALTFINNHTLRLRHILLLCVFMAGLLPTDLRSHPISHCHDQDEISHALSLKLAAAHHHQGHQHNVTPLPAAEFSDISGKHHNSNTNCHFRGKNTLIAKRGITSPDHAPLGLPIEKYYLPLTTDLKGGYHPHSLPSRSTAKFIFASTDLPPPSA